MKNATISFRSTLKHQLFGSLAEKDQSPDKMDKHKSL